MTATIIGFHSLQLIAPNPGETASDYSQLIGNPARSVTSNNPHIETENIQLIISAPPPESTQTSGIRGLALRVNDLTGWQRRLKRLGLLPQNKSAAETDQPLHRALETDTSKTLGLALTFTDKRPTSATAPLSASVMGSITGVDHIVVASSHPDASAALWGARLGLDMRLDLSRPDWGVQLMFFRVGDAILEIAHSLNEASTSTQDSWYGISWRTDDADLCRERIHGLGFDVSEVRAGRKPGSRVFTVRDAPANIPTLVIQPA
ncbi:MAG: VOC family protein [Halieaceae bacterium]|jgi:hypothetical protein|nr:VOC family protein [Halieaceae bacterium]